MTGYCGVGIYHAKWDANVGTLWRSAHCFGAHFIYTVGPRFKHQPTDTTVASRQIPYWQFDTWEDFEEHVPDACSLVGVELAAEARPLEVFIHPKRAVYLLGPEDGSLPPDVLARCQSVISFTSKYCLNVAMAGTIVLYDRQVKMVKTEAVIT